MMYKITDAGVWNGRVDGSDANVLRWHQVVNLVDITQTSLPYSNQGDIVFIGYCTDEGVRRNKGRLGASTAPDIIRKYCSNFPVHQQVKKLIDIGNIYCDDGDLESSFDAIGQIIKDLKSKNYFPIIIGGGHEITYGVFCGLRDSVLNQSFGILNFDAHFDVREVEPSLGFTSGTTFFQINKERQQIGQSFNYFPIGIQTESNTQQLFEIFEEMKSNIIMQEGFHAFNQSLHEQMIDEFMEANQSVHLTIDMDVFNIAFAPGVSAVNGWGIFPDWYFKHVLKYIIKSGKLTSCDIAEVNPIFDNDFKTIKLASSIIYEIVRQLQD